MHFVLASNIPYIHFIKERIIITLIVLLFYISIIISIIIITMNMYMNIGYIYELFSELLDLNQ